MFDGDAAGVKAAMRGVDIILKEDMNVRIVLLPEEHDPDTFARAHSSDELRDYIAANSQDFLAFKARLLLDEATNDPQLRTAAIKDMVESIALIPDSIKRSEYVKYCANIMSADEQVLAVDVARRQDGVAGNREAQDFLTRQQHRERAALPESSLYVAAPKSDGVSQPAPITGGTTMETLERTLTKYLVKSGHVDFFVIEDGTEERYNVASFIFDEMDSDELSFSNPIYATIYSEYRALWEQLDEGVEVPTHTLVNHHDPRVSSTVIDLLTADDNYVISKIWEQKDIHIESEADQLADAVPQAMMVYKWRTIDERMAKLQAQMADPDIEEEEMQRIMSLYAKYLAVRVAISRKTGRLI
jgi:DNA primase